MWEVFEHKKVVRRLSRLPQEILKRYEKWKDIVTASGPEGLRLIKGFHDETLKGEWKGHRSSSLSRQYRVIYRVESDKLIVLVVELTPHDYRRKSIMEMTDFRKAKKSTPVSVGESVRIIRELQELSQTELAELTKIPQSTISAIENNRINLGVERAKVVATALQVHPSVLVFPGWEVKNRRLHNPLMATNVKRT